VQLSDHQTFLIAVVLYGLSSVYTIFLHRRGFQKSDRINYLLLTAAGMLHTLAMFQRGFSLQRCPIHNLYEATLFVGWTIVAAYLVIGMWARLRFLGAFASPLLFGLGVFALMPSLDPSPQNQPAFTGAGGWLSLHAALVLLSYGAFGLSAVAAVMYLTQEHNLKFNKLRAAFSLLPPIQRLELVTGRLLMLGFCLLTAGLLVGMLTLKQSEGVYFKGDTKVLWSALVWCACLSLLVSRWGFAQRGRKLAWGTVAMFSFVVLTFWGSNLLSGIHNPPALPPQNEAPRQ
jgi:ABC-type transport system involved in cytochrome c biogenesis permease subunit